MNHDKDNVKQFFTRLLSEFQEIKQTLKTEISDSGLEGKQFREAFKKWNEKFTKCIERNRETYLKIAEKDFDFSEFMKTVGEEYQAENDIMKTIMTIKKELDDLMSFMAPRLAKDKSIFEVKSI